MERRYELNALLKTMGTPNVYFQPPDNVSMKYPCIVYERARNDVRFADNTPYKHTQRYTLTVIDPEVDSEIVENVKLLPLCTHNRYFAADNLNHDVFDLYF